MKKLVKVLCVHDHCTVIMYCSIYMSYFTNFTLANASIFLSCTNTIIISLGSSIMFVDFFLLYYLCSIAIELFLLFKYTFLHVFIK